MSSSQWRFGLAAMLCSALGGTFALGLVAGARLADPSLHLGAHAAPDEVGLRAGADAKHPRYERAVALGLIAELAVGVDSVVRAAATAGAAVDRALQQVDVAALVT